MARNNKDQGFTVAPKKNTKYADNVNMKAFAHYVAQNPPPTHPNSKLVLFKIDDGMYGEKKKKDEDLSILRGLMELSVPTIWNYVDGFIRGYRKSFKKLDYHDQYELNVKKMDYDVEGAMKLYSAGTFKSKSSNVINGFNRMVQNVHGAMQKAGTLTEHWIDPPLLHIGKDVYSLNCQKVMYNFLITYNLFFFLLHIIFILTLCLNMISNYCCYTGYNRNC